MSRGKRLVALAAAVGFGFAVPGTGLAQENPVGADAYNVSCAVCHGTSGQGDGEFADVLTVKPPNLTRLSAENDGEFPYLQVFHAIDGRTTIRAHGSAAMPIWGDFFAAGIGEAGGPYGKELLIRAKIVALVDYVETLQVE